MASSTSQSQEEGNCIAEDLPGRTRTRYHRRDGFSQSTQRQEAQNGLERTAFREVAIFLPALQSESHASLSTGSGDAWPLHADSFGGRFFHARHLELVHLE